MQSALTALLFAASVAVALSDHHCGHNQQWNDCGPVSDTCGAWRQNGGGQGWGNGGSDCQSGCYCQNGFARDEWTNTCVSTSQCGGGGGGRVASGGGSSGRRARSDCGNSQGGCGGSGRVVASSGRRARTDCGNSQGGCGGSGRVVGSSGRRARTDCGNSKGGCGGSGRVVASSGRRARASCGHSSCRNEAWRACGRRSQDTCSRRNSYGSRGSGCQAGYFCRSGYVRDDSSNECIARSQCGGGGRSGGSSRKVSLTKIAARPAVRRAPVRRVQHQQSCSGAHERYSDCGSASREACGSWGMDFSGSGNDCSSGCFCDEGHYRNGAGSCVARQDCGSRYNRDSRQRAGARRGGYRSEGHHSHNDQNLCGLYEEWNSCGVAQQATCSNRSPANYDSDACNSGCFCRPGYVRDHHDSCVQPCDC